MKYNPTQLANALGWQTGDSAGPKGARVLKSMVLSDGVTEIPYSDALHKDLEAFEDRAKVRAADASVQPIRAAS